VVVVVLLLAGAVMFAVDTRRSPIARSTVSRDAAAVWTELARRPWTEGRVGGGAVGAV
jgi:hypothetical protein